MNTSVLADLLEEDRSGYWGSEPGSSEIDARVVRNGDLTPFSINLAKCPLRSFSLAEFERARIRPRDIIITTSGDCGKVAVIDSELGEPFVASNFVRILRPLPNRVHWQYLYYWLRSTAVQEQLHAFVRGTTMPNLAFRQFAETALVPLAGDLDEQSSIAALFTKGDSIRQKRRQTIDLLEDLQHATFLEMFGDPVTNPKGWTTTTIGSLCDRGGSVVDGPFGSSLKPDQYVETGVRVVRNWNINDDWFDGAQFKYITEEKFAEVRRSEVLAGDILITTKGTVGDVCIMPALEGRAVLSASGTVRFRLPPSNELIAAFLVRQLVLPSYKRYMRSFEAGSAQHYLNLGAVRQFRVIVPDPTLQLQLADVREKVRALKGKLETAFDSSDNLFESVLTRAFKGELQISSHAQASRADVEATRV
jgi:type I restriction enzyme S subunit